MIDTILQRLSLILAFTRDCVATRTRHGMSGFLALRIAARLGFIRAHLPLAIARAALPVRRRQPRPYVPRPPEQWPPTDTWRAMRLPDSEGWLLRRTRETQNPGIDALRHLLAEPEMAALAGTPRVRRLLRPLCRMFGISDCLPPLTQPGDPPATPTPAAIATRPPDPSRQRLDQPLVMSPYLRFHHPFEFMKPA